MNLNKLKFSLLIAAVIIMVFAVQVDADVIEIDVWHSMSSGYGLEFIEDIGDEFNEMQDDIEVNIVYSGGYQETLEGAQAALAAGDPPNVSMFEQSRGAAFVDAEAVLSLEPFFEEDDSVDLDDFFPELMATSTYEGTVYGIPYNTSTPLLYYNKEMFEEAGLEGPPEDWDEILEYSQILQDELGVYGIDFYPWGWLFEAWTGQAGARVLNEDLTEFTLNSPEAVEAMEFTQDLVHEYGVATYGSGAEGYDNFFGENLAMTQRSTAALESNRESADFDMGVAITPAGPAGHYVPFGGGNFFMFDTGTEEEQQASWEFLKFIIEAENWAEFAASTGYMAAHEEAYNHEILQERFEEVPEARLTYDQIEDGHPRPQVPFWGEIHSELGWLFDRMFAEQADVQESLDQIKELGDRLIDVYGLGR